VTSAPAVSLPSSVFKSTSQSRSSRGIRKFRRTYSLPRSARCRAAAGRAGSRCRPRALLGEAVDEPAGLAVLDLRDDPADAARHDRPCLPECLVTSGRSPPGRLLNHGRECTWKALTSTEPMLFRFERM
jgi:hypothetical protein